MRPATRNPVIWQLCQENGRVRLLWPKRFLTTLRIPSLWIKSRTLIRLWECTSGSECHMVASALFVDLVVHVYQFNWFPHSIELSDSWFGFSVYALRILSDCLQNDMLRHQIVRVFRVTSIFYMSYEYVLTFNCHIDFQTKPRCLYMATIRGRWKSPSLESWQNCHRETWLW